MIAHSAALRLLTKDPILVDHLLTNYRTAPLDGPERAMLDFAVKVTEASHECTPQDLQTLRQAGWTDEDIMDITEVAAMFNFTNRMASALGMMPNPEFHGLGR